MGWVGVRVRVRVGVQVTGNGKAGVRRKGAAAPGRASITYGDS